MKYWLFIIAGLSLAGSVFSPAQSSRVPPKYEVRAVWVATVSSLDWPRSLDPAEQQRSLRVIVQKLADANFNTIYFQVRGRGDALYRSRYEPWSAALTGTIGKDPGWDPLEYIINEAHAHGMELHAWFNTFLVKNAAGGGRQSIVNRHPEWVHIVNGEWWLDPGIPSAREYTINVAMDIVHKYDIDGLHFDFMRYPEKGFPDEDTYGRFANRKLSRADWRRANINAFISALYDSVIAVNPRIKVGSAPIGIYHNVSGINGLQSYDNLYQDSRRWLREGYQDYIVPQVYWPLGRSGGHPDFAAVAKDWSINTFGRQVILGTAPYKAEVARQMPLLIDTTRSYGFSGNAFFRYEQIEPLRTVGMRYRYPAFVPPMPWKDSIPPYPPVAMRVINSIGNVFHISWKQPQPSRDGGRVKYFNIYRSSAEPIDISDIRNLVRSVGATGLSYDDEIDRPTAVKYYYTVTAMDSGNNESGPSVEESVVIPEIVKLAGKFAPQFTMAGPVPAVADHFVYFTYEIPEPSSVVLGIYDASNNEMLSVVNGFEEAGRYIVAANVEKFKDGEYRYRLIASKGTFRGVFSVEK